MSTITTRRGRPPFPPMPRIESSSRTSRGAFMRRSWNKLPENSPVRVAYDGRDMEIMTKSQEHEDLAKFLGYLVVEVARVLKLPFKGLGETTWKRPLLSRGIEADHCYYFDAAKLQQAALAKGGKDVSLIPDPDLAIEVDISPPLADREGIYAAPRGYRTLGLREQQTPDQSTRSRSPVPSCNGQR